MSVAPGGRRLYVYYRVPLADLAAVVGTARGLQAALRVLHPGIDAVLLRRPESRDGMATLMETYAAADGVGEALADEIERLAADAGLPRPRHVEVFEPPA